MNTEDFTVLAKRLADNPAYLVHLERESLHELLLDHSAGLLEGESAQLACQLIEHNPTAAAIWKEFQAIDEKVAVHLDNQAGNEAAMTPHVVTQVGHERYPQAADFFTRLSTWILETFSGLQLQGGYADAVTGQRKVFPTGPDDPYKPRLVQDRMGRWYLRVVTEDAEAARVRLRLELEREAPVLEFQPGEGEFFAEVRLTEAMAEALKSGHRPVFHSLE